MLELGFPQSTLQALDLSSDASQTAVCAVLCARCSELSTQWPCIALDRERPFGGSTLRHTRDTLLFGLKQEQILENFSRSFYPPFHEIGCP